MGLIGKLISALKRKDKKVEEQAVETAAAQVEVQAEVAPAPVVEAPKAEEQKAAKPPKKPRGPKQQAVIPSPKKGKAGKK